MKFDNFRIQYEKKIQFFWMKPPMGSLPAAAAGIVSLRQGWILKTYILYTLALRGHAALQHI